MRYVIATVAIVAMFTGSYFYKNQLKNNNQNKTIATSETITTDQLEEKIKNNQAEIIDVREQGEHDIIHIKNSKLISLSELPARLNEIDWAKDVIFICRSGVRSQTAANLVATTNKNVFSLSGGIYQLYKDGKSDLLEISPGGLGDYF